MKITSCRQSAPSFKSWKLADPTFKGFGKGQVPTARVLVATDEAGYSWVHFKVFRMGEHERARQIQTCVEARGFIDTAHWRKADRREY